MSYDLMVFDPASAPVDREEFMEWYERQTTWTEEHGYNDASVSTPRLRAWFLEMIAAFPQMNGPFATEDGDNPRVTDYSVGTTVVYAAFAWSQALEAHRAVVELAMKHEVGFFDASSDIGVIWRPGSINIYYVFYCFNGSDESVPANRPVAAGLDYVCNTLIHKLRTDRDFIGLEDTKGTTIQFMYYAELDKVWLEIPLVEKKGSLGGYFDRAGLEAFLAVLPATFSAEAYPQLTFSAW